jgi:Protein of unknown function (DUF2490)
MRPAPRLTAAFPRWSRPARQAWLGLALILLGAGSGLAQSTSLEFWPELDFWYRLAPDWRLSSLVPLTKYCESKSRDLNVYFQADYAFGSTKRARYLRLVDENRAGPMKLWLARGGVMKGRSIGDDSGDYSEEMLYAELHYRAPLKGGFVFSNRVRVDSRWLGENDDHSYRYRYRAMLEKEVNRGTRSFVPYMSVEPFWDSRYDKITRTRLIAGTTLSLGPRFAYEVNLTYQYDETYDTSNLYALNVILHVYFESRSAKAK